MTTRKLFVSHSSKTVENTDLLRAICTSLQTNDNGWYVLVDRGGGIYPTLDWEQRLDEWLAECHAAVILVSVAALESWWVQKEATILKWRWRLDPNFRHLFLVLLNGLSPDVFDRPSYRILNLKQIQCLTGHGDDANEIINTIENVLPRDDPATTPFDDLQAVIRDLLSSRTTDTLRRACDAIQL